jgi:hypothetical protein
VKRGRQNGLRFVAWLCVLVLFVAAVSPAGAAPAIVAPLPLIPGEPACCLALRGAGETSPPDVFVPRGLPARAPPLA